jgi:hypothetical protein
MWIGFVVGGFSLFGWLIVKSVDGTWVRTQAVLLEDGAVVLARWVTAQGVIHERELAGWESDQLSGTREPDLYYRERDPERMRLEPVSAASGVLRMVGMILVGIGAISALVSFALLFVEG